jgi:hypothetical protein
VVVDTIVLVVELAVEVVMDPLLEEVVMIDTLMMTTIMMTTVEAVVIEEDEETNVDSMLVASPLRLESAI